MALTNSAKKAARARKRISAGALAQIGMMQDGARHAREHRTKAQEDPRVVVINARSRQIGSPKGPVDHPIYGHPCGIAIDHEARDWDEAQALWSVWHNMDRAHGLFCTRVIEIRRHPAAGRMDLVHDRMEADAASPPADTRSDEERHSDAVNGWRLWEVRVSRLSQEQQLAIMGTMWGRIEPIRSGRILRAGRLMVEGMRHLREQCKKGR